MNCLRARPFSQAWLAALTAALCLGLGCSANSESDFDPSTLRLDGDPWAASIALTIVQFGTADTLHCDIAWTASFGQDSVFFSPDTLHTAIPSGTEVHCEGLDPFPWEYVGMNLWTVRVADTIVVRDFKLTAPYFAKLAILGPDRLRGPIHPSYNLPGVLQLGR